MGQPASRTFALDIDQFTRLDQRLKKQNECLERIAVALEGGSNGTPEQGGAAAGSSEETGPGYIRRFTDI